MAADVLHADPGRPTRSAPDRGPLDAEPIGGRDEIAAQARGIAEVDRIAVDVGVKIQLPPGYPDGVRCSPAAHARVVVALAEADQSGVAVEDAAAKAERLEARIRVGDGVAVGVVVDPLGDRAVGGVDDEPDASVRVGDHPIGLSSMQDLGQASVRVVHETREDGARAIELRDWNVARPQHAIDQRAVDTLADAPADGVGDVIDAPSAGQHDGNKHATLVIRVSGRSLGTLA